MLIRINRFTQISVIRGLVLTRSKRVNKVGALTFILQ